MTTHVAPFPDDSERQLLKRFQQVLRRGVGRGPLRVSCIQPRQVVPFGRHVPDQDTLQQRQHPQPDQRLADQARGMLLRLHRRQRKGASFQPTHVPLDKILAAAGRQRLPQVQLGVGLGGGIYPPAQPAHGRLDHRLVDAGCHADLPLLPHGCRPAAIVAQRPRAHVVFIAHAQQSLNLIPSQDGVDRLLQRGQLDQSSLLPPPIVQGGHCGLRLARPGAKPRLPCLGQLSRAYHQPPFGTADRFPSDHSRERLQPLVTLGDQLPRAVRALTDNWGQRLVPRPNRGQVLSQCRRQQLDLRWRWCYPAARARAAGHIHAAGVEPTRLQRRPSGHRYSRPPGPPPSGRTAIQGRTHCPVQPRRVWFGQSTVAQHRLKPTRGNWVGKCLSSRD
jgi:hypothetical protein